MARKSDHLHSAERVHTRWTLIERLKQQEPASWREFSSIYGKLIHGVATKAGCTRDEAQEVVQETLISVAKQISLFSTDPDRGSFSMWLLTIARRRIVDQLRKRPPRGRFVESSGSTTGTPLVNRIPDNMPDLREYWDAEWRQSLFQRAVENLKTQANPAHFKIFYLAVIKDQPVRDVAKALSVSSAKVYLVKHRLSALLKREMREMDDGNL